MKNLLQETRLPKQEKKVADVIALPIALVLIILFYLIKVLTKFLMRFKKQLFRLSVTVLVVFFLTAFFMPRVTAPKADASHPQVVVAATPTPSELENIVAYIARVFEPEGKDVVVKAINCFYSESGLRSSAVGQNTDGPKSKDHGVAQLNDYWHNLSAEEKTEVKANIDRAYKIYKGRGNFSAWYGGGCR